ncbi:MAG: ribosome maturation factor RimP [Candidatus Eiseniibacteriota bacterium]
MDVRSEVLEIATPLVEELGFELVDVEFVQSGRWTLRVSIDKAGGVSIDDCSRVSKRLGDALEMNQTVSTRFVLEVSSPGIERRLRTPEHFSRYVGQKVFVQTHDLIDGRRRVEGTLLEAKNGAILVGLEEGGSWSAPVAAIQKAHLVVDPWAQIRARQGTGKESQ